MAKKTVTEVLEIEAGAVLNALRNDGWPISSVEKVEVVDASGEPFKGKFGGLRFTYVNDAVIVRAERPK
jgi:hypothetical protein